MFGKNGQTEIVELLTEIRDLLKEGRVNAILTGLIAGVENQTIHQAAGPLLQAAIEAESDMRGKK